MRRAPVVHFFVEITAYYDLSALVQSGTLDLAAGGTDVGATYEAGAGTIKFGGSTRTLDATAVARARLRLISVWR